MVCAKCGEQFLADATLCPRCRAGVADGEAEVKVQDRGPAIVVLGILAILFLGPLSGVPGWIMANQDLRDLQAGVIQASASGTVRLGRVLNIIGTFFSPVWLFCLAIVAFVVAEMLIAFLSFL